MGQQIKIGAEARAKLLEGFKLANACVAPSLGPKGKSMVADYDERYKVLIVDDGITIAKAIKHPDPLVQAGVKLARETSESANNASGDGSSTTIVLAAAMLEEGIKNITAGSNPTLLKRGVEMAATEIKSELQKISTPTQTKKELAQVATISANDTVVGEVVAEAIDKVGTKGFISVEWGSQPGINLEMVDGMQIGKGYIHPAFVNRTNGNCEFNDCYVAVIDQKVMTVDAITPLLQLVVLGEHAKPLLIICNEIEDPAYSFILGNKMKKGYQFCVVKTPSSGAFRHEIIGDICALTGATVLGGGTNKALKDVKLTDLGRVDAMIADTDYTLLRVNKKPQAINERIEAIEAELGTTKEPVRLEHLNLRLAGLGKGIGLIKVCTPTDTETQAKMAKVEDAKNAAMAAAQSGIIPGGGVALLRCAGILDSLLATPGQHADIYTGINIVKKALSAPIMQIAENAGYPGIVVLDKVSGMKAHEGFDADKGQYVDMVKAGIIDATKVIETSFANAVSAVSTILSSEVLIVNSPDDNMVDGIAGAVINKIRSTRG